jgi:hypothetical protein
MTMKKLLKIMMAMVVAVLFLLAGLEQIVLPNREADDLLGGRPERMYVNAGTGEQVYQDPAGIAAFHEEIAGKTTRPCLGEAGDRQMNGRIVTLNYQSDKGRTLVVDEDGRAFLLVDKGDIRNKSRLHWLWWKLDTDRRTSLYYVTEPDEKVAKAARAIRDSMKKS